MPVERSRCEAAWSTLGALCDSRLDPPCNRRATVGTLPCLRQDGFRTLRTGHPTVSRRRRLAGEEQALLLAMESAATDQIAHRQRVCAGTGTDRYYCGKEEKRAHGSLTRSVRSAQRLSSVRQPQRFVRQDA